MVRRPNECHTAKGCKMGHSVCIAPASWTGIGLKEDLNWHNPTFNERAVDPEHKDSSIQSGFATDLSDQICWQSDRVKIWAFGHTHFNCDFIDEKTGKRVVANQRGYYFKQSQGYAGNKVIVLRQDT
ncbi:hypothetical protein F4677DRAFT_434781 [Hypoxylon crocopeplum]|nr:hypothetical protein F4677DRAFT_434781 [Hypoxylon crocopeplum]